MPVCPALSVRMTRLRVKQGACAPDRVMSMLSYPATGMTCMVWMMGESMAVSSQRTRQGFLLSKTQPGMRYCIPTASLRAPLP